MIKKTLTLGYNLLNLGQVDNMKLGTITVSTIFRPVASVTRSGIFLGCLFFFYIVEYIKKS